MPRLPGSELETLEQIKKLCAHAHDRWGVQFIFLTCDRHRAVLSHCSSDLTDLVSKIEPTATLPSALRVATVQRDLVHLQSGDITFGSLNITIQRRVMLLALNVVISKRKTRLPWDTPLEEVQQTLTWWPTGVPWMSPQQTDAGHLPVIMAAIADHFEPAMLKTIIKKLYKAQLGPKDDQAVRIAINKLMEGATQDDVLECQAARPNRTGARASANGSIKLLGKDDVKLSTIYNAVIAAGGAQTVFEGDDNEALQQVGVSLGFAHITGWRDRFKVCWKKHLQPLTEEPLAPEPEADDAPRLPSSLQLQQTTGQVQRGAPPAGAPGASLLAPAVPPSAGPSTALVRTLPPAPLSDVSLGRLPRAASRGVSQLVLAEAGKKRRGTGAGGARKKVASSSAPAPSADVSA